jgi:hypothetical protein
MLRTTLILPLLLFSLQSRGNFQGDTLKNTSFPKRLTEDISIYGFWNPFGDISDELSFLDSNGNIQGDRGIVTSPLRKPTSFLTDLEIIYVRKLLSPYSLDLPPPISL